MPLDLEKLAHDRQIKYFLVSFSDLAGTLRAKLVPAAAIGAMSRNGAGFAGFATWFDMTPADPDILAVPDTDSLIQLPWKPEVAWVAADLRMNNRPVCQAPRHVLKEAIARAGEQGFELRTGVECEFFVLDAASPTPATVSRNPVMTSRRSCGIMT